MHATDHRARLESVARDRASNLVEPRPQLEIDVKADLRGLVDEERQSFIESRQLRGDGTQLPEREAAHTALRRSMTHLVEMVRMGEYERASVEIENVELDQVDSGVDRRSERPQGVLGSQGSGTPMTDPEHATRGTMKLDQDRLRGTRRVRCSHHRAARATATACTTTIATASWAVCRQNASG